MHFYKKIENMTGVTSGVGAAYHSGAAKLAPCFSLLFLFA
jgi:hypothetical protein